MPFSHRGGIGKLGLRSNQQDRLPNGLALVGAQLYRRSFPQLAREKFRKLSMSKILVVDDSQTVRLVGRRIMSKFGFEVLEAEHGAAALNMVDQHPDVTAILLDWNMPVMDGLEFLKSLRALPLEKQPVVVMCTTENDMEHIMQAVEAGANEYIMKPFTEDIIRDKFQEVGVL
uniref:Response regulator receiver protein n=2 Tax=Rubinisphaera brasiliensis TaxID=119 RepID=F0SG51_RUBBR|nr:response regulator receiver protein [Rubinisphaera brasiliensis DSM 5305]